MINEFALILVLFAVYLSECIFLPSGHASLFKRSIRGRWRVSLPTSPATSLYRVVVEGLLPQLGSVFVAEPAPPLISLSGVCCFLGRADTASPKYIDFANTEPFLSKGCTVSSGSEVVCFSGTAQQAHLLSELLAKVKVSDSTRRDALITADLRRMLNTRRAAQRWKAYQKASGFLSLGSWTMFGTLVALFAMLVLFRFQAVAAWPLAVLILLVIPHTAYVFYRVHVIFFRRKVEDRWRQIALMFLTPPACIRASDFIAHELFAGFHSLAVSRVLLGNVESRDFAARTLREMMYPLDIDEPNDSSGAAEWAKAKWMKLVWEWIEQEFGDPRQLIDAPRKATAGCVCYCPRCLTQYLFLRGFCSDCPGVTVKSF